MSPVAEPVSQENDFRSREDASAPPAKSPASGATFDPFAERFFGPESLSVERLRAPALQRAQRLYGNRASQHMVMRARVLQRHCACGGTCAKCQEDEQRALQRSSAGHSAAGDGIPATQGEPLDATTRRPLERHFGADLADVRVHTSTAAAESAERVDALAYTAGRDIYFSSGMYAPLSSSGKRLLAHEVAHVVQQSAGKEPTLAAKSAHGVKIGAADDSLEDEAEEKAEEFISGPQPELTDEDQRQKLASPGSVQRFVQRQCNSGAVCTPPIPGAPGQYASKTLTEEEPGRKQLAAQPPAQVQALGHGREAVNLERMAREAGYDLRLVHGIFVDLAIKAGGWSRPCTDVLPTYSGTPNLCIFFSDELEKGAQLYYSDPTASQIPQNGKPVDRALFRTQALQFIAHELGHATFGAASRPAPAGTTCDRSTIVYTDTSTTPPRQYNLNYYLSELVAIMSEFPALYRGAITGDQAVRDYVKVWFAYKVDTAAESIKGILTSLRCKCSCQDVDAYVRDTFKFTAEKWTQDQRNVFNAIMSAWPGVNWPLYGDPICLDQCEDAFKSCLSGYSAPGMGGMQCVAARSQCLGGCHA
jgi:hypothetical protein